MPQWKVLFEDQMGSDAEWQVLPNGTALLTPAEVVTDDPTAQNGDLLRYSGFHTVEHARNIAYNPARLYQISWHVRAGAAVDSVLYAGFSGIAEDGVTRVNNRGENSIGRQYFVAANSAAVAGGGTWLTFTGYAQGLADVPSGTPAHPDPEDPGTLRTGVAYVRPLLYANYPPSDETVVLDVDMVRVAEYAPDDELTLTAHVSPSPNQDTVTFAVAGAKTPGTYAIATGDGGTVPVTVGADGTGTSAPYTYTMPGEWFYTASVTVPVTPPYATWADVPAAVATWADMPADTESWGWLAVTSETATTEVFVDVQPVTDPWPAESDRLTLTATVSDTPTGTNLAHFLLVNAKAPAGTVVQLDPGDGTTTVAMEIQADGTATGEKTYLKPGRHVYTATVTVPMEARWESWQEVGDTVPTWGAFVADTATWYYAAGTSETATTEVEILAGDGAIWATAVDTTVPPYVQLDTWSNRPADVTAWTVTRNCPAVPVLDQVVIWSGGSHPGAYSLEDNEAPYGVPLSYTLRVTYADGTTDSFVSNTVTLYGPTGFGGCWITDPMTGSSMRITIQDWTTRERASRQSVLAVMNRPDPIVLSDSHLWPSGDIVFITRNQTELVQARQILFGGSRMILVRSWAGSSIEAAYMAVGDLSEDRIYPFDPYAWDRSITVEFQETKPVPATARQLNTSWLDLYTAYTTWADVDAAFPSWADVIAWNPDTAFPATARAVAAL